MKFIKYLLLGIFFGITLAKAEVISWYRIYEMFRFASFHMFGVIGSAIVVGIILIQLIKRSGIKSMDGNEIVLMPKELSIPRYLIGGILFGIGWAFTGSCPGPMFILLGHGTSVILAVIASALAGTFTYGMLRKYLPH